MSLEDMADFERETGGPFRWEDASYPSEDELEFARQSAYDMSRMQYWADDWADIGMYEYLIGYGETPPEDFETPSSLANAMVSSAVSAMLEQLGDFNGLAMEAVEKYREDLLIHTLFTRLLPMQDRNELDIAKATEAIDEALEKLESGLTKEAKAALAETDYEKYVDDGNLPMALNELAFALDLDWKERGELAEVFIDAFLERVS